MSTYLNKTLGTATNRKKFTISAWVKRSNIGDANYILAAGTNRDDYIDDFRFDGTGKLIFDGYSLGSTWRLKTNRRFKDVGAWYHVVVRYDSTQSTSSERLKMYVNGEGQTDFETATYPSQDYETFFNKNVEHTVGCNLTAGSAPALVFYKGYIAQLIFVDGTAYSESAFGSLNSNGVWIPNTSPSITYGNNGFKLDFVNSGTGADANGFGADTSGQGNHFASNSLLTNPNTTDTPHNNFATLDPNNDRTQGGFTFSEANTKVVTSGSNRNYATLTQAFTSGKWYMECRFTGGADSGAVGVCDMSDLNMTNTSSLGDNANEIGVNATGAYEKNNVVTSGWAGTFTTNDILGLCLDCDNNRFTLSKNGQFADGSGNYDEANPTAYLTYTTGNFMTFAVGERTNTATATIEINTGNSPYAIASGNADANGYGSFEYAVPSGYYAPCTKNLAQYGG